MRLSSMSKLLGAAITCVTLSVSAAELSDQAKLGTELTPMGADPSANADGTIPAWTGAIRGTPPGIQYDGAGSAYPNPFADQKPLFSITGQNYMQYKDRLSDGQVALFKKYPDTYRMDIYPTHRDFRYGEQSEARTKWNVGNATLVNGVDGLQQCTGGAPFPIPESGAEVMWNARINQPTPVADGLYDSVLVNANGQMQRERSEMIYESPYAYDSHPVGKVGEDIGDIAAYVFLRAIEPARKKGEMVIVHEPLDQVKHQRKAWVYIPGTQRVKRAPNAGYDTPVGPGGLITADDNMGFNGAMDRYDWKLIGKREMYIPYHNYTFDEPGLPYETLIPENHANPDYIRYELHRVWVVEATLKSEARHVYERRLFFVAEDNWLIASTESYDGRGELWRVGFQNTVYDFFLQGYIARAQSNYDLQANAYVTVRLTNQTRPTNYAMQVKGADFYTPKNLRKMGKR